MPRLRYLVCSLVVAASPLLPAQDRVAAEKPDPWWSAEVAAALERSGPQKSEWLDTLGRVAKADRPELAFLLEHMPPKDLRSLTGDFLLENITLAKRALARAPWGKSIPRRVFLDDILPYANVSETREPWRRDFFRRLWPLVETCKTPGEAAQVLNREIFKKLGVRYSTKRRRADQSPAESMASGIASCTGLSILLTDACRAVAVPARLVGIPRWVNKRGNHTWVEVWDRSWHFTGAAEWTAKGLDHAWFQGDAALASADKPEHSIYAVSYRRTETTFPMVWARGADPVSAVLVTSRYTGAPKLGPTESRLMVCVRETKAGPRVVAKVTVLHQADGAEAFAGDSRGEDQDTNDFLTFVVDKLRAYRIRVQAGSQVREVAFRSNGDPEQRVDIVLGASSAAGPSAVDQEIEAAAAAWFAATPAQREDLKFASGIEARLRKDPAAVRQAVWRAYRSSDIHRDLRADFAAKRVREGGYESPYTLKYVGEKPDGGWPLFVAMHGGGGAPKRVNDSQWRHMQVYYRDQPTVKGYAYIALRAPNDTWNGFYDHYVWPLITRLVRQFTVCAEVDPDRVFLMGYSHGGYGAFAIGPNIPDRFAAVHASAAAPTPGISPAVNLRNLRFTYMIGERDTRYGRLERCRAFDAAIGKLREEGSKAYPVTMEYRPGKGHGGLPDRDKIRDMYPARRNHSPTVVDWQVTGTTVGDFYWISNPAPQKGQRIHAAWQGNTLVLRTEKVDRLAIGLDQRWIDFDRPVVVEVNGQRKEHQVAPSMAVLCASLARRGDPQLACTARIEVELKR